MFKKLTLLLVSMVATFFYSTAIAQPIDFSAPFNRSLDNLNQTYNRGVQLDMQQQQLELARQRQEAELRAMQQQADFQNQANDNNYRQVEPQRDFDPAQRESILKGTIGDLMLTNLVLTQAAVKNTFDYAMNGSEIAPESGNYLIENSKHFIRYSNKTKQKLTAMIDSGIYNQSEMNFIQDHINIYKYIGNQAEYAHDYFAKKDKELLDGYKKNQKLVDDYLASIY